MSRWPPYPLSDSPICSYRGHRLASSRHVLPGVYRRAVKGAGIPNSAAQSFGEIAQMFSSLAAELDFDAPFPEASGFLLLKLAGRNDEAGLGNPLLQQYHY